MTRTRFAGCHRSTAANLVDVFKKIGRILIVAMAIVCARARIEQAVGKLKRFTRIALRCEKTARNYGSFVALVCGFILVRSLPTA